MLQIQNIKANDQSNSYTPQALGKKGQLHACVIKMSIHIISIRSSENSCSNRKKKG